MSRVKRYQNPELYERLAAEYVLGTLQGAARKRFERLINERPYIRYAVDIWEGRLNTLSEVLPEEKPGAHVWNNIRQQIAHQSPREKPLWERLGFWQLATGLLSVLLVTAILLPRQTGLMPTPNFVAVLESSEDKPMIVTTGMRDLGMLDVRLLEMPKAKNQQWVLWAIPKEGMEPIQVGTLRQDSMQTRLHLTEAKWKQIHGVEMFAVSFEPNGGKAVQQQPTGPMMYKGKCLDFI
ncbi:MAG TPA: hypothetical protein EYH06_06400 [Chromatiales bacterium]|nr:hypothetical protein [Thiotrichales bacterium]HIP68211.1 hypothetical protein [Chromatiales bacterium]